MKPLATLASITAIAALAALPACKSKEDAKKAPADDKSDPGAVKPTEAGASGTKPAKPAVPPKALEADSGEHKGDHMWSVRFGGTSPDAGRALALDSKGGYRVAGYVKGKVDFGQGEHAADGSDAFVLNVDADGKLIWANAFGGPGEDTADCVAVDGEGNTIAGGSFGEKFVIGDGSLPSAGADDAFIVKLAADGHRLWAKRFGGTNIDATHSVSTDSKGNIIATGVFREQADIAGKTYTSEGDADIFLVKLDPSGKPLWVQTMGARGFDIGRTVATDSADNIYLLVDYSRTLTIGETKLQSNGNRDIGLIKLDPTGKALWAKSTGNNLDELALNLAIDPADSVIITGSFDDSISFGGDQLVSAGESDAFVAKYDTNGEHQWSTRFGDKDKDIGAAVATDEFGNVYAAGWFWFKPNFGGGERKSNGKQDLFLVKLNAKGEHLWSKSFGNKEPDFAKGLVVNSDGSITMAGTFSVEVNFGGEPLTAAAEKDAMLPVGDVYLTRLTR
jgi:hypothetical protein